MSQLVTVSPIQSSVIDRIERATAILALAAIFALAVRFVLRYVLPYYAHYDETSFGPYWTRRGALLLHSGGGTIALLIGPWQFWSGFRKASMYVHRWTGAIFLAGVVAAGGGAIYLATTTTFGWPFGFGLFTMAVVQLSASGMAYYAISKRQIEFHKEWMIRAYVVTFAFVTFRVFSDFGPTAQLQRRIDLFVTLSWATWAVPLLVTELILQFRRMRRQCVRGRSSARLEAGASR